MKLTLEEIGRMAGVSRSTVSRVINNEKSVRPEVRRRVQDVISETGKEDREEFSPDELRSLKQKLKNLGYLD